MEQEENNTIFFLDVQVTRRADGTLAHTVHRKPTHTDRYLHSSSFHHPRFKSAVRNTLVRRAFNTCHQDVPSAKLKSRPSTQHQTRFKHLFTHTRTSKTLEPRPVFTAFPANVVKYTPERPAATYLPESRNIKHTADWDTWTNPPSSNIHKNKIISSTGNKPSSSHLSSSGTNAESGRQSR